MIDHILAADREAEARAAAPIAVDPIQQTVSEEIKDAIVVGARRRRRASPSWASRWVARYTKLKAANEGWKDAKYDATFVENVAGLSEQFGKQRSDDAGVRRLWRENLELICFEYDSG